MIQDLTFRVEVETSQKAVALRDRLAAEIEGEDGVTLVAASSSESVRPYVVQTVNVETREVEQVVVEAAGPGDAAEQVSSDALVVVGDPAPAS